MARYTGPVCRLCRREGTKLYLKGDRCYSEKCALNERGFAPGQHGQGRKNLTEYGRQLREKQKVKRYYGVSESQMAKNYDIAEKEEGITGENLLKILELRLDNVVYRMGLASSRVEARQLVNHGHFTVNGEKVDIPSYRVEAGDVIGISERSRRNEKFKDIIANHATTTVEWVSMDLENYKGTVVSEPTRDDIDLPVEELLIVELYSR